MLCVLVFAHCYQPICQHGFFGRYKEAGFPKQIFIREISQKGWFWIHHPPPPQKKVTNQKFRISRNRQIFCVVTGNLLGQFRFKKFRWNAYFYCVFLSCLVLKDKWKKENKRFLTRSTFIFFCFVCVSESLGWGLLVFFFWWVEGCFGDFVFQDTKKTPLQFQRLLLLCLTRDS